MAAKPSYLLFDVTLLRRAQISPSIVRFTFTGPHVDQMATYAPDQRIKLFFSSNESSLDALFSVVQQQSHDWYEAYRALPETQRPAMRTYTIRALRAECAEVDVEFVLHGDNGPASRWAMNARPGDRLGMTAPVIGAPGPHLGFEWKPPKGVRRILIIADETAVPAAMGILEALHDIPDHPQVEALLEVPCSDDAQALPSAAKMHWLARDTDPTSQYGELLLRAVRDIDLAQEIKALGGKPVKVASGNIEDSIEDSIGDSIGDSEEPLWEPAAVNDSAPFYAWIAAETKVARRLRRYLVNECGLPKQYVTSMGYWRLGKENS
ncbi:siderophore-interacting protein [Vreelandella zhanjiangensis]|uniref:siderophore-interacting protein n=1 Tax=Vreelandella zhanjiangensis TaxID=1121960 RepID=UPI00402AD3BD